MNPQQHLHLPQDLTLDEIEAIEKQSLRCLYTAVVDFGFDAFNIFNQSPDEPKDIAEDTTREILDRLGGYHVQQRILGNVDYRKARYIILPDFSVRQALFVDSKAEQTNGTATLQMSQLSLSIRQIRGGEETNQSGSLSPISTHGGQSFITTTLLAHYHYKEEDKQHKLKQIKIAAIPNGFLQDRYNLDSDNTIWLVGRNAQTLNEAFRVRLSFPALKSKMTWRVQVISYDARERTIRSEWDD